MDVVRVYGTLLPAEPMAIDRFWEGVDIFSCIPTGEHTGQEGSHLMSPHKGWMQTHSHIYGPGQTQQTTQQNKHEFAGRRVVHGVRREMRQWGRE